MRRKRTAWGIAIAAGVTGLVAASALAVTQAAGTQAKATTVKVTLKEWKVTPSRTTAKAGKVTFVVSNKGTKEHEFVVIKTKKPANALPMKGRQASEKGAVDEIEEFDAGLTKRLTLTLTKGKYVLICNLPGHYKRGQYASFTVG
jgi:uncharacterized cupredoxin-like copper-binding protein